MVFMWVFCSGRVVGRENPLSRARATILTYIWRVAGFEPEWEARVLPLRHPAPHDYHPCAHKEVFSLLFTNFGQLLMAFFFDGQSKCDDVPRISNVRLLRLLKFPGEACRCSHNNFKMISQNTPNKLYFVDVVKK